MNFVLTNHIRKRFKERFGRLKEVEWSSFYKVDAFINHLLETSEPENSYLNNSCFMSYLYDRYGFDTRFEFLVNHSHRIVFVINQVEETRGRNAGKQTIKLVKTCFPTDGQMFAVRTKYGK